MHNATRFRFPSAVTIPHTIVRFPREGVDGEPFVYGRHPSRHAARQHASAMVELLRQAGLGDNYELTVMPVATLVDRGLDTPR